MPVILAVCGGLSGCATSTNTSGTASLAPTVAASDPILPDMVSSVPSFNPASGTAEEGMRSLAREVEMNASAQPAAYAAPTGSASLAAVQSQSMAAAETVPVPPGVRTRQPVAARSDANRPAGEPIEQDEPSTLQTAVALSTDAAKVTLASLGDAAETLPQRFGRSDDDVTHTRPAPEGRFGPPHGVAARSPELDQLIRQYAAYYDVPEELVRKVARRESTFNPRARNGRYLGLMQISHATARGMGYRGAPSGLLDAETNLKYGVRYLRGAYVVAKGNHSVADRLYQSGYYYHAKRAGLLDETGVGTDRKRRRRL